MLRLEGIDGDGGGVVSLKYTSSGQKEEATQREKYNSVGLRQVVLRLFVLSTTKVLVGVLLPVVRFFLRHERVAACFCFRAALYRMR